MDFDAPSPTPAEPTSRSDSGLLAGAIVVLVLGAILAIYLVLQDESTDVDTTSPTTTAVAAATDDAEPDSAPDTNAPAVSEPATSLPGADADAAETSRPSFGDDGAGDSSFGGPQSLTVHTAAGFGTLVLSNNGTLARTSADGLDWAETPTTGIPPQARVNQLVVAGDTFVAALQQWPDFDGVDEQRWYLEPETGPMLSLATSADLLSWDSTVLPSFGPETTYGTTEYLTGLAADDDRVVALITVTENRPNPLRLLRDAGLIDESDFESFCGFDWEAAQAGEAISIYSCDFDAEEAAHLEFEQAMEAAESDEERSTIEEEFERNFIEPEQDVIAVVEPGTALYAEFQFIVREDEGPRGTTLAVSGPAGGPYNATPLPTGGYPIGVARTGDAFVAAVGLPNERGVVFLASDDGVLWNERSRLETGGVYQLAVSGSVIVAAGGDEAGPRIFTSPDGGQTWSESELGTELYQTWGLIVGGPAGVATWIQGSTEPYEDFMPAPLEVTKDGYVLQLDFVTERLTLTAPDGTLVRDIGGFVGVLEGQVDGVAFSNGETVTFLDPDSEEPLVTFTAEDFDNADRDNETDLPEAAEPPLASELHFTSDGTTWRRLESPERHGSGVFHQLVAVGDDEVLLSVTTWVEPPANLLGFDLEGRDPTDDEMAALDEWFATNDGGGTTEWVRLPISP